MICARNPVTCIKFLRKFSGCDVDFFSNLHSKNNLLLSTSQARFGELFKCIIGLFCDPFRFADNAGCGELSYPQDAVLFQLNRRYVQLSARVIVATAFSINQN